MRRGPDLHLTIRGDLMLLKGWEAQRCARLVAPDYQPAQFSPSGSGWVLPVHHLGDVLAYAQSCSLFAVVTDQRRDKASA